MEMGVKATDLGTTNFTGYAKQGVIDKSKAIETASNFDLGTQAVEYLKDQADAYHQYNTLKGVAEEIGGVIQEQADRSYEGQAALEEESQGLQQEIDYVRGEKGYTGDYAPMLNQQLADETRGVQNALAEKTDRLTKAREQGVMTEFELQTRLSAITREAIARNPQLAPEIMKHVGQVAEMNDLTAKVKYDAAITKANQASSEAMAKKKHDQYAEDIEKSGGLPSQFMLPDGTLDYDSADTFIKKHGAVVVTKNIMENINKSTEQGIKFETDKLFGDPTSIDTMLGANNLKAREMIDTIKSMPISDGEKMNKIKEELNKQKSWNRATLIAGGINLQDERVKAYLEDANANIDDMIVSMTEDITMKNNTDVIKGQNAYIEESGKNRIIKQPGVQDSISKATILKSISPSYAGDWDIALNNNFKLVEGFLTNSPHSFGDPLAIRTTKTYFEPKGINGATAYSQSLDSIYANHLQKETSPVNNINTAMEKAFQVINSGSSEDVSGVARELVKGIADDRYTVEYSKKLPSNLRGNAKNVALVYGRGAYENGIIPELNKYPETKISVADDGFVVVEGKANRALNIRAKELNDSFTAYHKISGNSSLDKSINEFYTSVGLIGATEENK